MGSHDTDIQKNSYFQKNYSVINAASKDFIQFFGPKFTGLPTGHIETDVAAAASVAGLMIFRHHVDFELDVGSVILYPMDADMENMTWFINGSCHSLDLDPHSISSSIPEANKPLYSVPDMTCRVEKDFIAICRKHQLQEEFWPFVALLTALKLVAGGKKLCLLDQKIGIALVIYYYIAGAKTMPYPQEDFNEG